MAVMYCSFKNGNSLSIFGVMNFVSQLFRQTQRNGFMRGHVEFNFQSLCNSMLLSKHLKNETKIILGPGSIEHK